MRIDSVRVSGADTIYYPFHSLREYCYNPTLTPAPGTLDSNGGSWLGKKVTQKSNGDFWFDNIWNDTVIIKTQANLGDSWVLYNDASTRHYIATVSSVDTMIILGTPDSVKIISIAAFNGSSINPSDPINKFKIILSKNHGFAEVFDLYTFPYRNPDTTCSRYDMYFTMAGSDFFSLPGDTIRVDSFQLFSQIDFHNPRLMEIYNSDSGISYNTIFSNDTNVLINFNKMPEEWGVGHAYFYVPLDTSCYPSSVYGIAHDYVYNHAGSISIHTFEACAQRSIYKIGVGRIYQDTCSDLVFYYENNTGITRRGKCKPLSVPTISATKPQIELYHNPANDQLNINVSGSKSHTIFITNLLGQIVTSAKTTQAHTIIQTNGIPAGIYIIKIAEENGLVTTRKIVIQH